MIKADKSLILQLYKKKLQINGAQCDINLVNKFASLLNLQKKSTHNSDSSIFINLLCGYLLW